jgi:hypothetical protein
MFISKAFSHQITRFFSAWTSAQKIYQNANRSFSKHSIKRLVKVAKMTKKFFEPIVEFSSGCASTRKSDKWLE